MFEKRLIEVISESYRPEGARVTVGAPVYDGECYPSPLVSLALNRFTRHLGIFGATGCGKTKTVQAIAEQLSDAGVPVFIADVKGDLAGMAASGEANEAVTERAASVGVDYAPKAYPVSFISLSGAFGEQIQTTVKSFGPVLLSKVMGLNEIQSSILSLVFKYCEDKGIALNTLENLRAVLVRLSDKPGDVKAYGGVSKASISVLLRNLLALEQQGADKLFGKSAFNVTSLLGKASDRRGTVTMLELADQAGNPALFSTFMVWLLSELYKKLPEVGDVAKPKLVFFLDEAHLLFTGATKAFLTHLEQTVRLIRSKGVSVVFISQAPSDISPVILSQLGNRIQHALRAFTADDEKALSAAARTFPKSAFYDIRETLNSMAIGEAMVSVLSEKGTPTEPVLTRIVPPSSRMGTLTANEWKVLGFGQAPAKVAVSPSEIDVSEVDIVSEETAEAPVVEKSTKKVARRAANPGLGHYIHNTFWLAATLALTLMIGALKVATAILGIGLPKRAHA